MLLECHCWHAVQSLRVIATSHTCMSCAMWRRWQQEWEYVEQLVAADVRNNSAWNQRAWLLQVRLAVLGNAC